MRRILIIAMGGFLIGIIIGCSKQVEQKKEEKSTPVTVEVPKTETPKLKSYPLDITSGIWTGNIGKDNDIEIQFFKNGKYKMLDSGYEIIGRYTLSSNSDGSYGLKMKDKEKIEGITFTDEYVGNINFEEYDILRHYGKWHISGHVTTNDSDLNKPSIFDFDWIQVQ